MANLSHHRPDKPPMPITSGMRVVATADLRRLQLLLLAVCAMEVVDLLFTLSKWRHG